jgi:hypothetical protein
VLSHKGNSEVGSGVMMFLCRVKETCVCRSEEMASATRNNSEWKLLISIVSKANRPMTPFLDLRDGEVTLATRSLAGASVQASRLQPHFDAM